MVLDAVHWLAFYGSSDGIQLVSGQLDILDVILDREGFFEGRETTETVS